LGRRTAPAGYGTEMETPLLFIPRTDGTRPPTSRYMTCCKSVADIRARCSMRVTPDIPARSPRPTRIWRAVGERREGETELATGPVTAPIDRRDRRLCLHGGSSAVIFILCVDCGGPRAGSPSPRTAPGRPWRPSGALPDGSIDEQRERRDGSGDWGTVVNVNVNVNVTSARPPTNRLTAGAGGRAERADSFTAPARGGSRDRLVLAHLHLGQTWGDLACTGRAASLCESCCCRCRVSGSCDGGSAARRPARHRCPLGAASGVRLVADVDVVGRWSDAKG